MAWGAMGRFHKGRAWNAIKSRKGEFSSWVHSARNGNLSREAAYAKFQALEIPGVGPAYFTKLICFLTASAGTTPTGYIMDQWTAKSVDLLVSTIDGEDASIVRITPGGYVDGRNEAARYERFCTVVEELGERIRHVGPERSKNAPWGIFAEEKLFSEGRGRGEWRNYVIESWKWRPAVRC